MLGYAHGEWPEESLGNYLACNPFIIGRSMSLSWPSRKIRRREEKKNYSVFHFYLRIFLFLLRRCCISPMECFALLSTFQTILSAFLIKQLEQMKHSKLAFRVNKYLREKEREKKIYMISFLKQPTILPTAKHYLLHLSLQIQMISINIVSLDSH